MNTESLQKKPYMVVNVTENFEDTWYSEFHSNIWIVIRDTKQGNKNEI